MIKKDKSYSATFKTEVIKKIADNNDDATLVKPSIIVIECHS